MQEEIPGYNHSVVIGYVSIPTDIDRQRYIALCYKTSTICIKCEDGSFHKRVPISDKDLQEIEFPLDPKGLGSPVVCINEPRKNQLMIVATFNWPDTIPDIREGQFKLRKRFLSSYVEISGSAKEKYLNLTINNEDGGQTYIGVLSKNNNGKLKIDVQGDIDLSVSREVNISSETGINIVTATEKDGKIQETTFKQSKDNNSFQNKKFEINAADQPMLLGNKTKDFLNDFIDEIASATVSTAIGTQPLINSSKIIKFKERVEELLSKIAFLE